MSNGLAIAAVTGTLTRLLEKLPKEPPDPTAAEPFDLVEVTARPLDKAGQNVQRDRLNVFLYQASLNGAWRNMDLPPAGRPGEPGHPPLALDLLYLLSAFSDSADDHRSHQLLGRAMRVLHDHPVLGRDEIKAALEQADLHAQIERVRIMPIAMPIDELSRLWSAFQTQYRLSTAYQVSVLLIESGRAPSGALPVLRRGRQDQGIFAVAGPGPTLSEARAPYPLPNARLDDPIVLNGDNLSTADAVARFSNPHLPAPIERPLAAGATADTLIVTFGDGADPNLISRWVPGFYTVSLKATRPSVPSWLSNGVSIGLAPRITVAPLTAPAGDVELTITCSPRLGAEQRPMLLVCGSPSTSPAARLFEAQIAPKTRTTPPDTTKPTTMTFVVPALPRGTYTLRLRVDGVDSIPLPPPDPNGRFRLEFDANQQVIVT